MLRLIELSAEIAKYNQMLLQHNDVLDKRNYNAEKCTQIIKKVNTIQKEFYELQYKWFSST